jgi:hypothetical protein
MYAVKIVSKIPETLVAKHRYLEQLGNPLKVAIVQKSAKTICGGFPSLEPKLPAW